MVRESYRRRANPLVWIVVVALVVVWILLSVSRPYPRDSKELRQKAQFHGIEVAIATFVADPGTDDYPPSNDNSLPPAHSEDPTPYGGAQKLADALVGWDLSGYHPGSNFRADGQSVDSSGATKAVYEVSEDNLKERKEPYIDLENANAFKLGDIYEPSVLKSAGIDPDNYVLCDVRAKKRHSGRKTGMPILYYRADTSKTAHDVDDSDNPENIYNYKDNYTLLGLGVPGKPDADHPMFADPGLFYKITKRNDEAAISNPYRSNSFILISAGKDGLYGTTDDISNFNKE